MQHSALSLQKTDSAIPLSDLGKYAEGWLLSGDIEQHSAQTLTFRRSLIQKLTWFLRSKNLDSCGVMELRAFLAYITHGHKEPGGRWGNPHLTQPVRPSTVASYYCHLRTFFRWVVEEGGLGSPPTDRIPVPTARADQVQPFTDDQVNALLAAARRSLYPRRDEALLLFLLDTGLRASELCSLTVGDGDTSGKRATVLGKGNKRRSVYFGKAAGRALWSYLKAEARTPKAEARTPTDPLFVSERGEALTRSGLLQLINRLGKAAAIRSARCSPHTFRHTFAVTFLRNGGNQFTLMQLLGHTNIDYSQMTADEMAAYTATASGRCVNPRCGILHVFVVKHRQELMARWLLTRLRLDKIDKKDLTDFAQLTMPNSSSPTEAKRSRATGSTATRRRIPSAPRVFGGGLPSLTFSRLASPRTRRRSTTP